MTTPCYLYFDIGNVLLHVSHEQANQAMADVAGMAPETMRQLVFSDSGLEWKFERGDLDEPAFLAALNQAAGCELDPAAIRKANNEIFRLNTDILPLVTSLRCSNHRLGVFSNTSSWHWAYMRHRFSFFSFFAGAALSFEIGAMKPEPAAYAAAASLAGCAPEEIFFVDDRPENVAAAIVAGFQAVQYTTAVALRDDLRSRGVHFNL
ncbi:HAD-IA family hydrolase [Lignipirellula cremea]|uniref:Alpha-D-glucose-1-phosphate phosphatase YihX n=1 Tax=Lignipirellula cremea TaxID=2528010 RepID=A0A518E1V1_9BACT|nr:HAD-IA family hydrolase [Lignipirellula cremea]QDU98069.1 Alpha-D-glucose-1-phosphate phosphatase YihX [Lignipirellula cremea]